MLFKHTMKLMFVLTLFVLSGCSHSNPLNQYRHDTVAKDLLSSAVRAEIKLGLAKHAYQAGYYYLSCMNGKKRGKTCNAIYQIMLANLKMKYQGLRLSDLQDKKLWSYVRNYYQENAFNRLPE